MSNTKANYTKITFQQSIVYIIHTNNKFKVFNKTGFEPGCANASFPHKHSKGPLIIIIKGTDCLLKSPLTGY